MNKHTSIGDLSLSVNRKRDRKLCRKHNRRYEASLYQVVIIISCDREMQVTIGRHDVQRIKSLVARNKKKRNRKDYRQKIDAITDHF